MVDFVLGRSPSVRLRPEAGILLGSMLLLAQAGWFPASAQTVDEMKDAMEMMVGSAAICADYLKRPELLEGTRETARVQLGKVGLSTADADAFSDRIAAEAMKDNNSEMQQQVACEIINIPTIK